MVYEHETHLHLLLIMEQSHGKEAKALVISVGNNLISSCKENLIRFLLTSLWEMSVLLSAHQTKSALQFLSSSTPSFPCTCTSHFNHSRIQVYLMSKFLTRHLSYYVLDIFEDIKDIKTKITITRLWRA